MSQGSYDENKWSILSNTLVCYNATIKIVHILNVNCRKCFVFKLLGDKFLLINNSNPKIDEFAFQLVHTANENAIIFAAYFHYITMVVPVHKL